jgi:hypothetical protein
MCILFRTQLIALRVHSVVEAHRRKAKARAVGCSCSIIQCTECSITATISHDLYIVFKKSNPHNIWSEEWSSYPQFTVREYGACSLVLSATNQQYFSLTTNQSFSQNKPAPAISHQPNEKFMSRSIGFGERRRTASSCYHLLLLEAKRPPECPALHGCTAYAGHVLA